MPITEKSKQNEWKTIIAIAKNNDFPINILTDLKTKIINREKQKRNQTQQQQEITTQRSKWVTFTCHSPLIRRITNLFKQTNVKIIFRATNTIQPNSNKQKHNDPSCIHKLKCNTCNKVYVGQSGRAIGTRFKEHIRYIRSNNSTSAYAAHILENRHAYGPKEKTLQLLKTCRKGKHMDCWEALYTQVLRHKEVLIDEQLIGGSNPLFQMATITHSLINNIHYSSRLNAEHITETQNSKWLNIGLVFFLLN